MKNKTKFIPGEYEAETHNLAHIKAKVIVDTNKIIDVKLTSCKGERSIEPDLKKYFVGKF